MLGTCWIAARPGVTKALREHQCREYSEAVETFQRITQPVSNYVSVPKTVLNSIAGWGNTYHSSLKDALLYEFKWNWHAFYCHPLCASFCRYPNSTHSFASEQGCIWYFILFPLIVEVWPVHRRQIRTINYHRKARKALRFETLKVEKLKLKLDFPCLPSQ